MTSRTSWSYSSIFGRMKVLGVLDCQLMQAEGVPDLGQLLFPGLEQAQPHEAALPASGRSLLQRHRALIAPAAVLVVSAINDHLGAPSSAAGQTSDTQHGGI